MLITRAVPNVMPLVLSQHHIGGTVADVDPSHQYSIAFCCCETDGSRGAV